MLQKAKYFQHFVLSQFIPHNTFSGLTLHKHSPYRPMLILDESSMPGAYLLIYRQSDQIQSVQCVLWYTLLSTLVYSYLNLT